MKLDDGVNNFLKHLWDLVSIGSNLLSVPVPSGCVSYFVSEKTLGLECNLLLTISPKHMKDLHK